MCAATRMAEWRCGHLPVTTCEPPLRLRCPVLLSIALSVAPAHAAPAGAAWVPRGDLARVLVVNDCTETAGDAMVSRLDPPTIYVCPAVVKLARRQQPGVEPFFLAHEYGHVALQTADEAAADCWAAQELARTAGGRRAVEAAREFFGRRGRQDDSERYGSGAARAERIRACAEQPAG